MQIGVVVEGDDLSANGRVRISFPALDGSIAWAHISTPVCCKDDPVPKVGTEVVVTFVDGDPRHPVIVGQLSQPR